MWVIHKNYCPPKLTLFLISFANIHIFQMPNLTRAILLNGKMENSFNFNLHPREKFLFFEKKMYHGIIQCSTTWFCMSRTELLQGSWLHILLIKNLWLVESRMAKFLKLVVILVTLLVLLTYYVCKYFIPHKYKHTIGV